MIISHNYKFMCSSSLLTMWSLLPEIFSWAATPWSGIADADVLHRVQSREKLKSPAICPPAIYAAMIECWKLDPSLRTSASAVLKTISEYVNNPHNNVNELETLDWPDVRAEHVYRQSDSVHVFYSTHNDEALKALEVSKEDLELGQKLGSGQFGTVHKGLLRRNGESLSVAVKILSSKVDSPFEQNQFEYEARLLSMLRHHNIVSLIAVGLNMRPPCVVLELMHGDLRTYLRDEATHCDITESLLLGACIQVASAMCYLEECRVIHRDLAARFERCLIIIIVIRCFMAYLNRNILVGARGLSSVKLSDVGLSRVLAASDYYRKVSSNKV